MTTGILHHPGEQAGEVVDPALRAGRVDRLIALPGRLPGPSLLWYAAVAPVLLVALNLPIWLTGALPLGSIDSELVAPALIVAYFIGAIAVLNVVARRAFREFRPALGARTGVDELAHDLISLPDRSSMVIVAAMEVLVTIGFFSNELERRRLGELPIAIAVVELVAWWLAVAAASLLGFHTVRQLRLVSRLHAAATSIDLLDPGPIVGFARLTSASALAWVLIAAVFVVAGAVEGTQGAGAFELVQPILFVVLGLLTFLLPLLGMHDRMAQEKARLQREANDRLRPTLVRVHAGVDTGDLATADQLNKTLASLLAERDLIGRLSTWPWSPGVVRGFLSAVLLPIVIWAVIRVLERVV